MACTAKQEALAKAYFNYLINGNAPPEGINVASYKAAKYAWEKMSKNSLETEACRALKTKDVAARIKELQAIHDAEYAKSVRWTVDKRLETLANVVKLATRTIVDKDGNEKAENLPVVVRAVEVMNSMLGTAERGKVKPVKVQIGVEDAS